MGGRRCIIIGRAAQVPTTAPSSSGGRKRVEKMVREVYQNSAIAGELDESQNYSGIISALSAEDMSQTQLQLLLDELHSFPDTP